MFLLLEKQDSLEGQEKHDSLSNQIVMLLLRKQLLENLRILLLEKQDNLELLEKQENLKN